jgi:hypothetical protein
MWSPESRAIASQRAKDRWADPEYRIKQGNSIKKPPCCSVCGEDNISNFYQDKNGLRTNKTCKTCHNQQCKDRWHNRTWIDRWSSRSNKYGVDKDFLIKMYEDQDGKCKICENLPTTQRGLHVDHCHTTGTVRGLLCHGCNTGIGNLKDDPILLQKAINYLTNNQF